MEWAVNTQSISSPSFPRLSNPQAIKPPATQKNKYPGSVLKYIYK